MLCPLPQPMLEQARYERVVAEVARGVKAVSGLEARAADERGWIAIRCHSAAMASWLSEAICAENVQARASDAHLLLPISDTFVLDDEIKSLVTVVAKSTDYWFNHLPPEARHALEAQARLRAWRERLAGWLRR